ncbi:MAG: hypothetical protein ACOY5Y_09190 [Pseudomonadota bacterium]|jgi:hypothetical protein
MRKLILAAGLMACLSITACSEQAPEPTAEAEAPRKSTGRPAQMYQGQGHVESIQSATVARSESGGVLLNANATVAGEGYTNPSFLPYIYPATPPDGIYEVDVVADAPATPGAAAPTAVEVKGAWDKYTDGRVKGIRFISKTNEVVAMLPAAGEAPAAE